MNPVLRIYMNAAGEELEGMAGNCLSESELIDYQAGRLTEEQRAAAQSHLMKCGPCRSALMDVAAFFEPARAGETEPDTRIEWQAFERRLRKEGRPQRAPLLPRPAFALAASLLIVTVPLTVFLALRMRLDLRDQVTALEERLLRAEREHEAQIADLRRPQLNAGVFDVYAKEVTTRSGGQAPAPQPVSVGEREGFTLILNASGQPAFAEYSVEVLGEKGEPVWRSDGLARANHGNYVITMPAGFLSPGTYTIRVSGKAPEGNRRLADYVISLRYRSE